MSQEMNTPTPPSRASTPLLGILVIGILLVALVLVLNLRTTLSGNTTAVATNTPNFSLGSAGVSIMDPGIEVTNFSMPSSLGETVSLSSLTVDNRYVLMYFGYTNCPDFCPLTLAEFEQVKATLGERAEQVNFAMISVDEVRDTPEVLREYMGRFDPEFVGLQGDEATLRLVADEYGLDFGPANATPAAVTTAGTPAPTSIHAEHASSGVVNHTTFSYLISPERRLVAIFNYNTPAQDIVATLQTLFAEASA